MSVKVEQVETRTEVIYRYAVNGAEPIPKDYSGRTFAPDRVDVVAVNGEIRKVTVYGSRILANGLGKDRYCALFTLRNGSWSTLDRTPAPAWLVEILTELEASK